MEREGTITPSITARLAKRASGSLRGEGIAGWEAGKGAETGRIGDFLRKEVSVKRKGSSLEEGQDLERREREEESLSFWRGSEGGEEEPERESSRDSASWMTTGSEKEDEEKRGVDGRSLVGFWMWGFRDGVGLRGKGHGEEEEKQKQQAMASLSLSLSC